MSTTADGSDYLFLFTYGNELFLDILFIVILSIYLFIYSKRCEKKQLQETTFVYLWKWIVLRHAFRFNIHDLFIYLLKAM